MLQPQSQDERAMFAQLRGRCGWSKGADHLLSPPRQTVPLGAGAAFLNTPADGDRTGAAGGCKAAVFRLTVRTALSSLFPAAAQETWVLVAEKIDSGEKPFLSSCSRGRR